jgi:hypothetical protein
VPRSGPMCFGARVMILFNLGVSVPVGLSQPACFHASACAVLQICLETMLAQWSTNLADLADLDTHVRS